MPLLCYNSFAASPDHWRSKQASKASAYKDFYSTFGSSDTKSTKNDGFLAGTSNNKSNPKTVKEVRKEINQSLGTAAPFLSMQGFKRNPKKAKQKSKNNAQIGDDNNCRREKKISKKKKVESGYDTAATAAARKSMKKRQRDGDVSKASLKKMKASDE